MALILTQSRAGWLGTAVVVPVVLVILLGPLIRAGSTSVRGATVVFLALFLAVGAFLSHANWSTIENNVLQERDQIAHVAQLDFSNPERVLSETGYACGRWAWRPSASAHCSGGRRVGPSG